MDLQGAKTCIVIHTLVESGSRILSFVGDRCHQTFAAEEARDEGEKLLLLGGVG